MVFRQPSRTTARGRHSRAGANRGASPLSGARRIAVVVSGLAAAAVLTVTPLVAGCGDTAGVPAYSGDKLTLGVTYSVDLDGDGVLEQVLIDGSPASLTITDGKVVYRSRDRWQVVEAGLGDTDRDGLLEVVTLLDDEEGRHIGLFAFFGGKYRERLVTSELNPPPLTFEVLGTSSGDQLLLTVEPAPGQNEPQQVLCRWNGFGFSSIEQLPAP